MTRTRAIVSHVYLTGRLEHALIGGERSIDLDKEGIHHYKFSLQYLLPMKMEKIHSDMLLHRILTVLMTFWRQSL
jgi:hypothetical protein